MPEASMATAGLRKMPVCVIQLQGKSHRLNGAVLLQPLTGMPTLPTRSQLGDVYSLLSPKWGRGALGWAGESALGQLWQRPAPAVGSGRGGGTPGLAFSSALAGRYSQK